MTLAPSSTAAPATRARSSSTASSSSRRMARPRSEKPRNPCDPANRPSKVTPSPACTRMPASVAIGAPASASSAPMSCSIRVACGLRYSAHALDRGKRARSTINVSTPFFASVHAVAEPAGPPPTTITSTCDGIGFIRASVVPRWRRLHQSKLRRCSRRRSRPSEARPRGRCDNCTGARDVPSIPCNGRTTGAPAG